MSTTDVTPNSEATGEETLVKHVVVVGGGPAAQRFAETMQARDKAGAYKITVISEENVETTIA